MIEGVKVIHLKRIPDERGAVFHMLKKTDEHFIEFGEIYFSCGHIGAIKAWHVHKKMTLNNCCISGMLKLVLYDSRTGSKTNGEVMEIFMGEQNYVLVQVPPGVVNGYKAYGEKMAIMANCATLPYDPDEIEYIDPLNNDIPYDWALKNK